MSATPPLAVFRRDEQKDDFVKLANEHIQSDLTKTDRDCLRQAAGRISNPAPVGTVVGLGLGIYAALRRRRIHGDMFRAFRAAEKPTHVVFTGGRMGAFRPSILGPAVPPRSDTPGAQSPCRT